MRPQRKKVYCSKLFVVGEVVWDTETLLNVWLSHFRKLVKLRLDETEKGKDQQRKIKALENQSHQNEEFLLDVPFTADEVSRAVTGLKKRKASGPDGLMTEHLSKRWRRSCCYLADEDSK